jgi:ornithine cyclodeaminase
MQHISSDQIDNCLTFPDLVENLRAAFQADWTTPVRAHHTISGIGEDKVLLLMPSWTDQKSTPYIGVKIVAVVPENGQRDLPSIHGMYYLMNGETGQPLATMDGARLTVWRTAAASGLASSYLSRPDSKVLTMVGSGALSPFMIRAHMAIRPIEEVFLWNHNIRNAHALAEKLRSEGLPVTSHPDLVTAVGKSDIVSAATLTKTPLIQGKWLKPGTHVDTVGAFTPEMRETDDDLVRTATIFCDTFGGALKEAGDLAIPIAAGVISKESVVGDLYSLTRGEHPGRKTAEEITYFKSVGTAVEDLAGAVAVWNAVQ